MIQLNFSDVPVSGVTFACFGLNHFLKLTSLHIDRGGCTSLLLLLRLVLEHLDLVLQAGEDETDHGRSAVQGTAGVHFLIERPDFGLIPLELHISCVAGDLLALNQLSFDLFGLS